MAPGISVVGVQLVHDDYFSGEATNLAVLVGDPGAGISRVGEQVDLRQPAWRAGLRGVWLAPVGCIWLEPFRAATQGQPSRREQRGGSAGSGDADEDEGAEAPGGLLCL
eukprot:scaffold33754_cov47-Phaeocystis_antarctica.AAC.2